MDTVEKSQKYAETAWLPWREKDQSRDCGHWDDTDLILPTKRGHPAKRVNYDKAEVNNDQTTQESQDHAAPTYARI